MIPPLFLQIYPQIFVANMSFVKEFLDTKHAGWALIKSRTVHESYYIPTLLEIHLLFDYSSNMDHLIVGAQILKSSRKNSSLLLV